MTVVDQLSNNYASNASNYDSPDRIAEALHAENVAFRAHLTQLDAAATFDFYGPGSHDWPYWQRELHRAWPFLTKALS